MKTKCLIFAIFLPLLTACSNIEPVKPWQRGNLAKNVMIKNTNAPHAALEAHSYVSKEGNATGGDFGGGGCGCN